MWQLLAEAADMGLHEQVELVSGGTTSQQAVALDTGKNGVPTAQILA